MPLRALTLAAALTLLAGCTSTVSVPSSAPVSVGEDTTPWGVLPRYEQGGLRPSKPRIMPRPGRTAAGRALADVLISRDGEVLDVRIIEATNGGTAAAALDLLKRSRYEPLPPAAPNRYVVRQSIIYNGPQTAGIPSGGMSTDGGGNSNMPANAPWPNLSEGRR